MKRFTDYEIRPARPEDIENLAPRLRKIDHREIWAVARQKPAEALARGLEGGAAWAALTQGQVILMWGVGRAGGLLQNQEYARCKGGPPMTVETQTNKVQYQGNGVAKNFPVPFPVLAPEHLRLFLWANQAQTEITEGFSVIGAGSPAVTVALLSAPAAGATLTILRRMPLVQRMDLKNGGPFNADILEGSADFTLMLIQQLAEAVGRAFVAPESLNLPDLMAFLKSARADEETAGAAPEAGFPAGGIIMWAGEAIPSGWALCNGENGTPDLRDRFIIGAGSAHSPGEAGGEAAHSHAVSGSVSLSGQVGATALTVDQMPSHTHRVDNILQASGSGYILTANAGSVRQFTNVTSNAAGGGASHTHSLSGSAALNNASAAKAPHLPPYYALCFIMKLKEEA